MYSSENAGLGIDLLGLKTLTVIDKLKKIKIKNIKLDISKIDLIDKVFSSAGETAGLFQLESAGMRSN